MNNYLPLFYSVWEIQQYREWIKKYLGLQN